MVSFIIWYFSRSCFLKAAQLKSDESRQSRLPGKLSSGAIFPAISVRLAKFVCFVFHVVCFIELLKGSLVNSEFLCQRQIKADNGKITNFI